MRRHIVLCLVTASLAGCSKDEVVGRPARVPRAEAAAEAPPVASSSSSAGASAPAASLPEAPPEPTDPLLTQPKDCGSARDNPYGVELAYPRRDGSCQVCERAPEALSVCSAAERARVTGRRELKALAGQRVQLRGTLSASYPICTKRGGVCACNNRCEAPLILARPGEAQAIALTSRAELLSCSGDEASVCCPFELDRSRRSIEVIVTGTWHEADAAAPQGHPSAERHLEVEKLCRF
jgi:hypothetical protein